MATSTFLMMTAFTLTCNGYVDYSGQRYYPMEGRWHDVKPHQNRDSRNYYIELDDGYWDSGTWCQGLHPCGSKASPIVGHSRHNNISYIILKDRPTNAKGQDHQALVARDGSSYRWIDRTGNSSERVQFEGRGSCIRRDVTTSPRGTAPVPTMNMSRWINAEMLTPDQRDRWTSPITLPFTVSVNAEGRVSGCTHGGRSGNMAELGAMVCQRLTRLGRFRPATNSRGEVVRGQYRSTFYYSPQ